MRSIVKRIRTACVRQHHVSLETDIILKIAFLTRIRWEAALTHAATGHTKWTLDTFVKAINAPLQFSTEQQAKG